MAWIRATDATGKPLANRSMINTETGEILSRRAYRQQEQLGGQTLEQNVTDRARYRGLTGEEPPKYWTPKRGDIPPVHHDTIKHMGTFQEEVFEIDFDFWEEVPALDNWAPAMRFIRNLDPEMECMVTVFGMTRTNHRSAGTQHKWVTVVELSYPADVPDVWGWGDMLTIEVVSVEYRYPPTDPNA